MLLKHERLPCRGCTTACVNFADCDGKPWLLRTQNLELSDSSAGLSTLGSNAQNAGLSRDVKAQRSTGASVGTMMVEN